MSGSSEHRSRAAAAAGKMQHETRRRRNFDEIEALLPFPALSRQNPAVALLSGKSLLSRLGSRNPFAADVSGGDVVWLLDNTAYRRSRMPHSSWEAEVVAAVFEHEPKCDVVEAVSGIARLLHLADDSRDMETIERRLMPFLWDIQPARRVKVEQERGDILNLGPTGPNGISSDVVKVERNDEGSFAKTYGMFPRGTRGLLQMETYYAGPEGWGVISDVDDTIKVTQTSDPIGILRETFIEEPRPIPGMPQLYSWMRKQLPRDTPWFYLSASPYNLYPFLRRFRDDHFPPGTLILRDSSWKTIAGLLSALTTGTEEYKVARMRKVHRWLPHRKMIIVGDSTQSDPEAYGELYRMYPDWVKLILIRKAVDIAALGIEKKNGPERFEKAFKGVPGEVWRVFEEPSDCMRWIEDAVRRG